MNITNLILLFVFLTIIANFGYIFSSKMAKEKDILVLIPLSVCFGISTYTVLLHFLSLSIGIKNATYFSLLILIFFSVILYLKPKYALTTKINLTNQQFFLVLVTALVTSGLSLWYLITFDSFDSLSHLIGPLLIQKKYPPVCHFSPEASFPYHYGSILLGASFSLFSKIECWNSLIPIQTIFIFITPIIIFTLIYSITKNFLSSLTGTFTGLFCSNLTLLGLFSPQGLKDFFSNPYRALALLNESGFATSTSKALITPNMAIAFPLTILIFYIYTSNKTNNKALIAILFLSSTFLFFTYESFWMLVVIGAIFYFLFFSIKNRKDLPSIKEKFITLVILLLSCLPTGNIIQNNELSISDLLFFNLKSYSYSWCGILSKLYSNSWLSIHEIISNTDGSYFYKIPFFSKAFFIDMSLPLILIPFIFLNLYKNKNIILISLFLSGIVSIAIPFFIDYLPREVETIRFFTYGRFVLSILCGILLGEFVQLNTKFKAFRITVISFIVFLFALPSIVWLIPIKMWATDYRYSKIHPADKKALRWLKSHATPGDRGIGPSNNSTLVDLINIAGVYGVGNSKLPIFETETRKTAFETLSPCLLKELKVRWIYINNDLLSKIPAKKVDDLLKSKMLTLKYTSISGKEIRQIYKFIPSNNLCKNKDYVWAIGKKIQGKLYPVTNTDTNSIITFDNIENAKQILEKINSKLAFKEAYWYRIEAFKI